MEYLGAWGTLIHEKNLKSKISCQTPFKPVCFQLRYLQTLNNISAEKNSTIVFPVPVDIITSLMNGWQKNHHSS